MSRKRVSLPLEQLVDVEQHPSDAFFVEVRCRICRWRAGAPDRETGLTEGALHLAEHHGAQGGHHRKPHARQTNRRKK